jgi:hypothetical protein
MIPAEVGFVDAGLQKVDGQTALDLGQSMRIRIDRCLKI